MVGVVGRKGRFAVAEPLFMRGGEQVALRDRGDARDGDIVLVGAGKKGARVFKLIGRPAIARDVVEALMLDRGLRRQFPRKVDAEADEGLAHGTEGERTDLRTLPTFTIDPDDAKDFDDAISARRGEDGVATVWVHIADVSAYVRPGTPLEGEALRRATSVYVPGAVEPMLPEALSNSACSLRPGEDKLAVTVEMDLVGTDVRRVAFYRSLIRSDARLTYGDVDAVFEGRERGQDPWAQPLAVAREVASDFRARRDERGALAVNSAEPSFRFDGEGHVVELTHEQTTEAHTLIEHLMILANEQVAGYLADRKLPTLYRVHERPDPQSVEFMLEQLDSLGIPTPPVPENMSPQQAADVAAEASHAATAFTERTGRGRIAFSSMVLRALKQAYYTPKNVGHAGLASPRYCHFTSPIRRYPDVVVHRALLSALSMDATAPQVGELGELGIDCSERERAAMKIERDADDVCRAFLLERTIGDLGGAGELPMFDGEIVGVIASGVFVRFGEQGFSGFMAVRRLRDYYVINEQATALVSEGAGRALRLGDPVTVAVERIEAPRGRVDLVPEAEV